ncbi:MAG TPA: RIO1 family regulatory kinase/ATPase [Propionibacteriaceae bacterium]
MSSPLDPQFDWDHLSYTPLDESLAENQRWSTWPSVERLHRGPTPYPDWLVTSSAAIDTDLGVLKAGKEADVVLVERALPGDPPQSCHLAAKRYRTIDHRLFRRDTGYTEGRRVRNTRDTRAMARKSSHGRAVEAGLWAGAEWSSLTRLYEAGVPVPYPVQLDGSEICMELITDSSADAAPRLHQLRPAFESMVSLYDQLLAAMRTMTAIGIVHGDLSPYNTLVADLDVSPRLVIIDVPQVVELASNPHAMAFLQRDCANMAHWFTSRGFHVDEGELVADLLGYAW